MRSSKRVRANFSLLVTVCFSALLIAAEIRVTQTVQNLKNNIAEAHAQAEHLSSRAHHLAEVLGQMQEELDRVKKLPITFAPNAESLAALIESSATNARLSCAVSVSAEDSEKIILDVSLHGTQQELLHLLREILSRPEMFFVERLECHKSAENRQNVQIRLCAFIKKEAA